MPDYLAKVKLLLGITDDLKDDLILLYIDLVNQEILNYCNLEELPPKLDLVLVRMTVNFYGIQQELNVAVDPNLQTVGSISEDGRSVNFIDKTSSRTLTSVSDLIHGDKWILKQLQQFRLPYRI